MKRSPRRVEPAAKLLLTIREAADRLGIGRTLMYELLRSGAIPSVRVGGCAASEPWIWRRTPPHSPPHPSTTPIPPPEGRQRHGTTEAQPTQLDLLQ